MSNKSSVKKTVIKLLKKRTLLTLLATTIFALVFIIFALNTSAATIGFANDSFFSLFTSKNILATQTPICDSAIHPVYLDIAAEGGQGSFEVLIESGCPWSAESNASWITTNSSGTTGGMVNFTVASTPDQGRSGTITIHTPVDTQTFTVLQKDKDCSFSLSPGFNRSPSTGGNSSFQVFPSRPQCEWTASSNNPWISLTGATGGVGNGTIDYNVAPNSGSFIRIGTIRVEDTLFTIQQDPLLPPPPCSPTSVFFNVSSANFGVVGGNGEFSVSTQTTGCRFTVTSNASWITITSGINDSPVKYTVAPNTGPARTGTISVSGRLFTVTQSESCNFVITPSSINIPAAGLTGSFAVTTGAECTWTARSEDIDVNILSGSGTGNGTVNYRVIRNTGEERTLRISVNGVVFTITQASGVCVTSIDPSSATFSSGFANSSFAVIAPSGCEWQSEDNASWISTFSTGTGNGVVNFSVLENYTDSLRTGTVKVGGRTFTITQTAWQGITCTYSITPLSQNISASGGNGSFQITTPTFCPWIARSNASWITTSSSGAGNGTINFIVAPNSGVARSGTIRVGGKLFTITQAAPTNCNYTINPTSANIAASGGNSSFSITVPSGCSWTATSQVSWITTTSSGTGNGTINFTVAANSGAARSGSVTVGGRTFTVNQAGNTVCNYSINPTSVNVAASGTNGSFNLTAQAGCTWTAQSNNPSWITTSSTGNGNGTVSFSVASNTGVARTGTISVAGQTFTVNQSAASGGTLIPVKVNSADSLVNDFFGNSVALSGDTAIVGSHGHAVSGNDDQGSAYIFIRNGSNWQLQQKLTMPTADAQVAAQFGYSVAISGDTAIVGAPTQDNGANTDQGAAYVYVRSGTTWTFQQRLRQSDGAVGDNFGWSVGIDGNTAVVGAYLDDESIYTDCGSAYAYLRTGTTWQEESRMVASERTSNSQMGYSVGISGDTIVIGARFAQTSAASADFGSAYIFTPVAGTPRVWTQRSILTAPQRSAGDQFGFSVSVSGNTALIGSRFDDVGANVDQGSAYIFTGTGFTWTFQRQLFANDGTANDEFGNAVSISGDRLIIGSPQNSTRNGRAYIFTGIGSNWIQLPVLVAPDGSAGDLYGSSVSISGSNAVIGAVFDDARRGSVYFLSGVPSANSKSVSDFDGDGKTDVSIFRPAPGEWWVSRSSDGGNFATQFGASTDKIVPADYTGDGKTDVAFWRPSSGQWFILRSEDSSFFAFPFGANGDTPVPADYDGDGKADAAVFRPSSLTWFINKSSGGTDIITFGATGDKPVVGDYDGDGKADIAIYRPNGANGAEWWIRRSSNGSVFATQFGTVSDKPVQGDYTGDGKADIAFWRPLNGNWFILRSEDFSFFAFPFGASGDIPVAGDYDGDGKFDAGVFRPSNNNWFIQRSTAGTLIQQFGIAGDLPTPNAFVP